MSAYPTLTAWIDRIEARPGAHAGLGVPERKKVILTKQEEEEDAKKNAKWVMEGQPKQG
jgi:hypothetical protein